MAELLVPIHWLDNPLGVTEGPIPPLMESHNHLFIRCLRSYSQNSLRGKESFAAAKYKLLHLIVCKYKLFHLVVCVWCVCVVVCVIVCVVCDTNLTSHSWGWVPQSLPRKWKMINPWRIYIHESASIGTRVCRSLNKSPESNNATEMGARHVFPVSNYPSIDRCIDWCLMINHLSQASQCI